MDPTGETMFGWLYDHDAIAAAEAPLRDPPGTPKLMSRPASQLAFELWRDALAPEDRVAIVGRRKGGLCPLPAPDPPGTPSLDHRGTRL